MSAEWLALVEGIDDEKARIERLARMLGSNLSEENFADIFPVLAGSDDPIAWEGASSRLKNVLRRQGDPTWGDISEIRPIDLLGSYGWRNFGEKSLAEVMGQGAYLSIRSGLTEVIHGGELQNAHQLERSIAYPDLEPALDSVLLELREREREIFLQRTIRENRPTLDEFGKKMRVTRERVRQIERRAERRVRELVSNDARLLRVREAIEELRLEIRGAIPADGLFESWRDAPSGDHAEMLLWLAGPFTSSGEWIVHDPRLDPSSPADDLIRGQNSLEGEVSAAVSVLERLGVPPEYCERWLADSPHVRIVNGTVVPWGGSVADKAAVLLRARGRPASPEYLVDAIGEGHNPRFARSQFFADERIVRVTKGEVGLAEWEHDEYQGVVAAIDDEIRSWGGLASRRALIESVVGKYGVSPSSVEIYLSAPRYVSEGKKVRLRRADEPFQVKASPPDRPNLYRSEDGRLVWRVIVDNDVLRGSGRSTPAALAKWLGLGLGESLVFENDKGNSLEIAWSDTSAAGPTVGSMRLLAEQHELEAGDLLFVEFGSDRVLGSFGARAKDLTSLSGLEALARSVGLGEGVRSEELVRAVAARVWIDSDSPTVAMLRRSLLQRGEEDLADLVLRASESGSGEPASGSGLDGLFIEALGSYVVEVRDEDGTIRFPEIDLRAPLPPRVRLYLFRARRDEKGRKTSSYRIQLTVGDRKGGPRFFDRSHEATPLVAGYVDELDVFVLWDAAMQEGADGFPYSKSCYVNLETVLGAAAKGTQTQEMTLRGPTRVEWIIATRASELPRAVRERAMLTIDSLTR